MDTATELIAWQCGRAFPSVLRRKARARSASEVKYGRARAGDDQREGARRQVCVWGKLR